MRASQQNCASRDQIVALQTLYTRCATHTMEGDDRGARLAWASESLGRALGSFSELSRDEARRLIDALKGSLGQIPNEKPQPWRKVLSRDRAQAAGTAGRRGAASSVIQMAGPDDFARIDQALRRLGWSREQYEGWLGSPRSPIPAGDPRAIRTVTDANRVWWALKAMLKRSGHWRPRSSQAGSDPVSKERNREAGNGESDTRIPVCQSRKKGESACLSRRRKPAKGARERHES